MGVVRSRVVFDVGFIAALLLAAALPLIVLNGSRQDLDHGILAGCYALWFALLATWILLSRRFFPEAPTASASPFTTQSVLKNCKYYGVIVGLLVVLVLMGYYRPMTKSFSGGYDEFYHFAKEAKEAWRPHMGRDVGRPYVGLSSYIGQVLTPGRIEGLVLWTVGLYVGNALLLFLLLRKIAPQLAALGMTAAVLFVVNNAEPMRYLVLWNGCYYGTTLFSLLLAMYLWVATYDSQNRIGLVAACVFLSIGLLANEGIFPLAAIAPVFLLFRAFLARQTNLASTVAEPVDKKRLIVWNTAWLGTIGLIAVNFVMYLHYRTGTSYQMQLASGVVNRPEVFLHNVVVQLKPALSLFQHARNFQGEYGLFGAGVFMLATSLLAWNWYATRHADTSLATVERRLPAIYYFGGMGLLAITFLLALAPFIHLDSVQRSQYYAAPAQAALIAGILCSGCSLIPSPWGRRCLVLAVGVLAGNATAVTLYEQDHPSTAVRFEKTIHIFEQVHAIAPCLPEDCLVLFVLDDNAATPVGANYGICEMSKVVLGPPALQANFVDPLMQTIFTPAGVGFQLFHKVVPYDRIVAFRLSEDGSVRLLRHLPQSVFPSVAIDAYNPWPFLRAVAATELPVMQTPFWCGRLADVVDARQGIILGDGWYPLNWDGDDLCRWAKSGAEIVVNGHGASSRTVDLEMEPACADPQRHGLLVLDEQGEIVATAEVKGRQQVRLQLPTRTDRATVFRLQLRPNAAPIGTENTWFRLFVAGAQVQQVPVWSKYKDIAASGIELTRNWDSLETWKGRTFRWVKGDGEFQVIPHGHARLFMDLAAGPGYAGKEAHCQILGPDGQILAETHFQRETRLEVDLPAELPPGSTLRLHAVGGGHEAVHETRVLNVRMFQCGWTQQ